MILVTIGTMFPFDRMLKAMDAWALAHPTEDVVAPGTMTGGYRPRHIRCGGLMSPIEFGELASASRLIVAHAGTGSYMLAAERARPIVILPRLAALKEHTSDHQLETARWLGGKKGVFVALNERDLPAAINAALSEPAVAVEPISPHAPIAFIAKLRGALAGLTEERQRT